MQSPAGDRYTTLVVPGGVTVISSTMLTGNDTIEFRINASGNHTITLTGKGNFVPVAVTSAMPTCTPGGGSMTTKPPPVPGNVLQARQAIDSGLAEAAQIEATIVSARALRGYPRRMDALSRLIFPPQPEQGFDPHGTPTPRPATRRGREDWAGRQISCRASAAVR